MKSCELDALLKKLSLLMQLEGLESVYARRVRTIQREVSALRKGGKVQTRRLVRIVALISELTADALLTRFDERK